MSKKTKQQIIVVGGGFGGIKAALELSRNKEFEVTLISDKLDFRYNPTLYHTATGGLFRQSSIPLSEILEGGNINFINAKLTKLDRDTQSIELDTGKIISYDKLVLALGVVTNYFGIDGLSEYSYGIKSPEEVKQFKAHLHELLQDEGKPDINYIIVGGGPTGVELAGALPTYIRQIMKRHGIKNRRINVKLIEAAPRILPNSAEKVSAAATKRLKKIGVQVMVHKMVQALDEDSLMVSSKDIPSHTVVWTAGTSNNPFFKDNDFALSERGKVTVDEHLIAEDNIYVIGDNANTPHSGLAQTAVRDGHYVAHDIEAKFHGNEGNRYKSKTLGTVVPVGNGWAAFEFGKFRLTGWLGWSMREAADWIGYHDLEPWWKASQQWATEFGSEEDCEICATEGKA
ncbi:MAG: FAD-dependent oxidoreductase [Candidatus Saccharibacteria bacterium]|nr:FAD-dependent oxidoreductase [Candidatus Saccharibacteria bacterium]